MLRPTLLIAVLLCFLPLAGSAQTGSPPAKTKPPAGAEPAAAPEPAQADPSADEPPHPAGAVLFSRHLPEPAASDAAPLPADEAAPAAAPQPEIVPNQPDPLHSTDAERNALTVTRYALDLHLAPATHGLSARAALTVRNDGSLPLTRLVLQISSSLRWDGLSIARPGAPLVRLTVARRRLATDADHTGWASEVVATLPEPLPPGASLPLAAVYSGAIPPSADRLERLGVPFDQAAAADWDAIASPGSGSFGTSIALRGLGNVLWYPVSAPPVFLGDGARLFNLVGHTRLREQAAEVSLRLAVEFAGDPPSTAFFCGRPQPLVAVRDNPDAPIAESTGVATASFDAQALGFRLPSLFVTDHPATVAGTTANPDLISATTEHFDALPSYSAAAAKVEPLLSEWLGPHPLEPLHLLDHAGQPFEDDTLLVRPVAGQNAADLASSLAHSLTHTWIRSAHPWIDEGLARFMALLWIERTEDRAAVIGLLDEGARTISLAEPDLSTSSADHAAGAGSPPAAAASSSSVPEASADAASTDAGQPLVSAWSDVFFRTKAAAVWWMLRGIVGDDALKQALKIYRQNPKADADPSALEHMLERASHQDLHWFFADWVDHDRGLPDLTIVNVIPRQIEGTARAGGWLVAIEVRNDGDCVADVPVTVRSLPGTSGAAAASETQRLRIPGHASASRRILFPVPPGEVQVNDGTVPETRVSIHTVRVGPAIP